MIGALLIVLVALIVFAISYGLLRFFISQARGDSTEIKKQLDRELKEREEVIESLVHLYGEMVDLDKCREALQKVSSAEESLKAERGRVTITMAELETVETRLRELEEIERELEASGLETKEELNILERKYKDLTGKNSSLKQSIADNSSMWDGTLSEVQANTELHTELLNAKSQLAATEERIQSLMVQIEQGNEQYFNLKRRYDALDIEYAQLYEKFSEAEQMASGANKPQQ